MKFLWYRDNVFDIRRSSRCWPKGHPERGGYRVSEKGEILIRRRRDLYDSTRLWLLSRFRVAGQWPSECRVKENKSGKKNLIQLKIQSPDKIVRYSKTDRSNSRGTKMKEQFNINSIRREVSSINKVKTKISRIWFVWIFAACAASSLASVFVFWHTNVFRDAILAQLELKNGTQTFSWWEKPPVRPLLKVRIFNYTNADEVMRNNSVKLRVKEVGPYIYRETITRKNVQFNDNGTMTYQEHVTHDWEGGSSEDETIVVPNVPFMMAYKKANSNLIGSFLAKGIPDWTLDWFAGIGPYKTLTVKEFLWGYTDNLVESAVQMSKYATIFPAMESLPYEKFGMLLFMSQLSKDRITIHTGSGDINNLALYQNLNGMSSRDVWKDEKCDKVEGTDGSMFPPNLIRDRNATLKIYTRDICRSLQLRYDSNSTSFGIPALRYKPTDDIFTSSNTTNSCFCQKSTDGEDRIQTCPPRGVFNMSACAFDLPFLFSFPHFYNGDESLLKNVEGLNPRKELHETYADIHPRLGITIGGWSRFQVSVEASRPFKDGLILPLVWVEIGIDQMPEMILDTLKFASFTVDGIESALQWGSLFATIVSMCAMGYMMKKHREMERPDSPSDRNLNKI